MSRSCYSDYFGDEFPGQLELYRANVERSIRSKAGQARLRELRDALLALPKKELVANIFAEPADDGPRVCALGAWAWAEARGDVDRAHAMVPRDADDHETFGALKARGWPKLVVFEAIYMNDEACAWKPESPAQRYIDVLRWVERQLLPPQAVGAVDPIGELGEATI